MFEYGVYEREQPGCQIFCCNILRMTDNHHPADVSVALVVHLVDLSVKTYPN